MKITKDNIISYGVVLFGSLLVAVGARISAQSIRADDSTVSITFWSAIILCFITYLLLQSAIEGCIGLLLKNKMPQTTEDQVQQVADIDVKADTPLSQQPKVERPVLRVVEIVKEQCTYTRYRSGYKGIQITIPKEIHLQQIEFSKTDEFKSQMKHRYKVEAKNAELKNQMGYNKADSYGLKNMEMQSALTLFTCNIKRILRLKEEKK